MGLGKPNILSVGKRRNKFAITWAMSMESTDGLPTNNLSVPLQSGYPTATTGVTGWKFSLNPKQPTTVAEFGSTKFVRVAVARALPQYKDATNYYFPGRAFLITPAGEMMIFSSRKTPLVVAAVDALFSIVNPGRAVGIDTEQYTSAIADTDSGNFTVVIENDYKVAGGVSDFTLSATSVTVTLYNFVPGDEHAEKLAANSTKG